jgi:peptidoglycan/LPS O-acetylase OafA/YrhL
MILQIIFVLAGAAILSKGEFRASKNRVVPAWAGRVVGAVIVVAAVVSWVLPDEPHWIPLAVCLLPALGAIVFGLAVARNDEEQPRA